MIKINPLSESIREITVKRPNKEIFSFMTLGATWTRWQRADGVEMLVRYDDFRDYLEPGIYPGSTVGPLAGRVENGRFTLGKKTYAFTEGKPILHCDDFGFSFENFALDYIRNYPEETVVAFKLRYAKKNYPGTITVAVEYLLRESEVRIVFRASTSSLSALNVTNHAYFNLDGDFTQPLASHELLVHADQVVLVDQDMIGRELLSVKGTPFDFLRRRSIVEACDSEILRDGPAKGLDHYFLLASKRPFALELVSRKAGKRLVVETSYPGVVLYATNHPLTKPIQTGKLIPVHGALAIEPQFMSNAINDSRFPGYELKKNEVYEHFIHYRLEAL